MPSKPEPTQPEPTQPEQTRPGLKQADQAENSAHSAQPAGVPFEASLTELNDLVNRLESGALGLSDSIGAYERGVAILRRLHEQLADVEERVKLLVRIDEQGRPIMEEIGSETMSPGKTGRPTGNGSTTDSDATARRATRPVSRTGRPKRLPGMDDAGEDG
jgi:exodeoxyribonuclease VII small subunit